MHFRKAQCLKISDQLISYHSSNYFYRYWRNFEINHQCLRWIKSSSVQTIGITWGQVSHSEYFCRFFICNFWHNYMNSVYFQGGHISKWPKKKNKVFQKEISLESFCCVLCCYFKDTYSVSKIMSEKKYLSTSKLKITDSATLLSKIHNSVNKVLAK